MNRYEKYLSNWMYISSYNIHQICNCIADITFTFQDFNTTFGTGFTSEKSLLGTIRRLYVKLRRSRSQYAIQSKMYSKMIQDAYKKRKKIPKITDWYKIMIMNYNPKFSTEKVINNLSNKGIMGYYYYENDLTIRKLLDYFSRYVTLCQNILQSEASYFYISQYYDRSATKLFNYPICLRIRICVEVGGVEYFYNTEYFDFNASNRTLDDIAEKIREYFIDSSKKPQDLDPTNPIKRDYPVVDLDTKIVFLCPMTKCYSNSMFLDRKNEIGKRGSLHLVYF